MHFGGTFSTASLLAGAVLCRPTLAAVSKVAVPNVSSHPV